MYGLQEAKGSISKSEGAGANEQQFAIFLLRTGLVVVRELGLLRHYHLCSVCLVVQSQGCVCVLKIVKGLILFPILLRSQWTRQELGSNRLDCRLLYHREGGPRTDWAWLCFQTPGCCAPTQYRLGQMAQRAFPKHKQRCCLSLERAASCASSLPGCQKGKTLSRQRSQKHRWCVAWLWPKLYFAVPALFGALSRRLWKLWHWPTWPLIPGRGVSPIG